MKRIYKQIAHNQSGQALVVMLLFISVLVTLVVSTVGISIINAKNGGSLNQSENAYSAAESGVDEAGIRLLRDPTFGNTPQTLTFGNGKAIVSVTTQNSTKTITSIGMVGNFVRKIQVVGNLTDTFTVTSWQEIK